MEKACIAAAAKRHAAGAYLRALGAVRGSSKDEPFIPETGWTPEQARAWLAWYDVHEPLVDELKASGERLLKFIPDMDDHPMNLEPKARELVAV